MTENHTHELVFVIHFKFSWWFSSGVHPVLDVVSKFWRNRVLKEPFSVNSSCINSLCLLWLLPSLIGLGGHICLYDTIHVSSED